MVRRCFDTKARRKYSSKINEWKNKWIKKGKAPKVIKDNTTLWDGLVAYWQLEATQGTSAQNSSNRKSQRNGKGEATHNLGATSKATRVQQLFEKTGVRPSHVDIIRDAHTNRKTGEIQDAIAREIVESVEKAGQEYLMSQPSVEGTQPLTEVPFDKVNEFTFEVTPKSRGRVYGLPEDSCSSVSSFRYHGGSSLVAQNAELTQRVISLEERYDREKAEAEARLQKQIEDAEERRKKDMEEVAAQHLREKTEADERYKAMEEKMNHFLRLQGL